MRLLKMKIQKRKGGCQCGEISYALLGSPIALYRCHCTDCQTGSGSAFGMSMWVKKDDFKLTSGILKSFIRTADSGAKIESFFCGACGVRICAKAAVFNSEHIVLKPGTLQNTDDLHPSADIWFSRQRTRTRDQKYSGCRLGRHAFGGMVREEVRRSSSSWQRLHGS